MGAGKTDAIVNLVTYLYERSGPNPDSEDENSLIVLSHRRFLAKQSSERLGIPCYMELSAERLREDPPRMLSLVINSLTRLSADRKYGVIVLDEAGLVRRHLFSETIGGRLLPIFHRLGELVRNAKHVIMLQDGISQRDVQFYTELANVDSDDCNHVAEFVCCPCDNVRQF